MLKKLYTLHTNNFPQFKSSYKISYTNTFSKRDAVKNEIGVYPLLRQPTFPTIRTSDNFLHTWCFSQFSDTSNFYLVYVALLRQNPLFRQPTSSTAHFSDKKYMTSSPTKKICPLLRQKIYAHFSDKKYMPASPTKKNY